EYDSRCRDEARDSVIRPQLPAFLRALFRTPTIRRATEVRSAAPVRVELCSVKSELAARGGDRGSGGRLCNEARLSSSLSPIAPVSPSPPTPSSDQTLRPAKSQSNLSFL